MAGKEVGYFTPAGVANHCSMHVNTVYKAIHANDLKHLRIGKSYRIRREWVDEWMEEMHAQSERALRSA